MKRKIEFEAWLRDGVGLEKDGEFEILSREGAKERISVLINAEEFEKAALIAKQLSKPIELTANRERKSVRVPFTTYLKLVEGALRENTSLDSYISKVLKKDLDDILARLKKRENVRRDKIEFLEDCFSKFYKERMSNSNEESRIKEEGTSYASRDQYTPSIDMPPNWEKVARKAIVDMRKDVIEKFSSSVDARVLEKYLDLTYVDEIFYEYILPETRPEIFLKNGKLIFKFSIDDFPYVPGSTEYEEIREEFGFEAIWALEKSIGDWAFSEDADTYWEIEEIFLETEIGATDDGKLIVNGIVVDPEDRELKTVRQHFNRTYEEEIVKAKEELSKYLEREKFDEVEKLSHLLEKLYNKKKRTDFALDLIAALLGKTQLVTFTLPQCLLYAWEAYGTDLTRIVFPKKEAVEK